MANIKEKMQSGIQFYRENKDVIDSAIDRVSGGLSRIADLYEINKRNEAEIKKLETLSNLEIERMKTKYTFYQNALEMVMGQRDTALSAHYRVLNNAITDNNREEIIEALRGISNIVTNNPLESLANFARTIENPNATLELDF